MGRTRDTESGKYTTNYTQDEFLDALEEYDGMAGTTEIADVVGCTQRTAYNRLTELEDEGVVASRDIGRALVWTRVDE